MRDRLRRVEVGHDRVVIRRRLEEDAAEVEVVRGIGREVVGDDFRHGVATMMVIGGGDVVQSGMRRERIT